MKRLLNYPLSGNKKALKVVILYTLIASSSVLIWSLATVKQPVSQSLPTPETEPCPLNGKKYNSNAKAQWEERRPMGIMVENLPDSRPQSGLSQADVIYEALIEGGATRFLAIYYCQQPEIAGPVRSARTYFLDWISEYGSYPLYVHVGGANTPGPANALGQIVTFGWSKFNDLNHHQVGFPTFWSDYDRLGKNVATEHVIYTSTIKAWQFAAKERGLR